MIRLTDEQWERIRDHFPEENISDGRPGRKPTPTRCVLEALWIVAGRQEKFHARQNPPFDQIVSGACRALSRLIVNLAQRLTCATRFRTSRGLMLGQLRLPAKSYCLRPWRERGLR